MKTAKYFLLLLTIVVIHTSTHACDICGCGLGNYYIGLFPQFNKGFIGLRYHYMRYHTQIAGNQTQFSNDYFQSVELWGGWNIGRKWQVLTFIPYSFNKQISDDGTNKINGLGDIALLINYTVLEKTSLTKNNKLVFQQLKIGGGVKLATGASHIDPTAPDIVALANSQLGSGSTDYMVNAAYTLKVDKLGFTTNANYKFNSANSEHYRFGNRFSSNTFLFYSIKARNLNFTPNVGLLYEQTESNKLGNEKVQQTGGYAALNALGLELNIKKISFGINVQAPISQNYASGQTQTKIRTMTHVTFAF